MAASRTQHHAGGQTHTGNAMANPIGVISIGWKNVMVRLVSCLVSSLLMSMDSAHNALETTAEMAAARNAGFEGVSLGPLVLRCETAAIFALSILSYELQNPS